MSAERAQSGAKHAEEVTRPTELQAKSAPRCDSARASGVRAPREHYSREVKNCTYTVLCGEAERSAQLWSLAGKIAHNTVYVAERTVFHFKCRACLARCLAELSARSCVRRSLKRKEINMLTYDLQKIIMEEIKKIADKYDGRGITSKYDRDLFDAWYNLLYLITEGVTLQEVNDEINSNLRLKKLKASLKKSSNIFISSVQ